MNEKDFCFLDFLADEYPPKRKTSNIPIKYPEYYKKLVDLTSFLPCDTTTTSQRLWHIRNRTKNIPICQSEGCSNNVKWVPAYTDYAKFCSKKCYNKNKTKKAEISKDIQQEKLYGKNHKNLTTYEKYKITNLNRHGYENPFCNPEIVKNANQKKYDRDFHFQKHIPKNVLEKINNSEWLKTQNHQLKKSCTQIADELGVNNTTINKAFYRAGIQINYEYSGSYNEKKLKTFLEENSIKVYSNNRDLIPPYEIDLYIPDHSLAIEYCGLYWHNELYKPANYHLTKKRLLNDKKITLLTIFEDEYIEKPLLVEKMILHRLGKSKEEPIYARNCVVKKISQQDKKIFLNQHHIQGNGPGSISLGLFWENQMVGVCTFINNRKGVYTLNRFATSRRVTGAFGKMLSYFKRNYDWTEIISFSDLRWSDGLLYKKLGFTLEKILEPDYYYVKNNKRLHKFNFRHKNLKKVLGSKYNPEKSEHENCLENNIFRLYDCGKYKYVLRKQ